ncbi:hypothetical protein NW762_014146 [Fusarium torreyae]|uniref:Uncharacterized protein n=1 Tax=Fusarium torreyae TaxID=1237075 RepID=A0A9W8RMZ2_9HYPO|nr:hypothetical protein NW762_014146 [Fusarium torreyae]
MKFSMAASLLGTANLAATTHPQDVKPTATVTAGGAIRVCPLPRPDTLRISDFNPVRHFTKNAHKVKSVSFTLNSDRIEYVKCSGPGPQWEYHVQCEGTRYRFALICEGAFDAGPTGQHGIPLKCKKSKTGETVCTQKQKEVKFRITN